METMFMNTENSKANDHANLFLTCHKLYPLILKTNIN